MGEAAVLPADPAIGAGERCAYGRRAQALSFGAGDEAPRRWHAAVTYPGCERAVREAMTARGIDTVVPMVRYWRVRNRKRLVEERPLIANAVLFGVEAGQRLVDLFDRYRWDADDRLMRPAPGPQVAVPIPGIERIVRGASDRWAVLPTRQVWDLRFAILRGDFDATVREALNVDLPPIVRWLLEHGDLPRTSILTHQEARRAGLNFSSAA